MTSDTKCVYKKVVGAIKFCTFRLQAANNLVYIRKSPNITKKDQKVKFYSSEIKLICRKIEMKACCKNHQCFSKTLETS